MDIYAEIDQRRAERFARRQARLEREARIERVLGPLRVAGELVLWVVMVYLYLFVGCLWAAA